MVNNGKGLHHTTGFSGKNRNSSDLLCWDGMDLPAIQLACAAIGFNQPCLLEFSSERASGRKSSFCASPPLRLQTGGPEALARGNP
jgi:hypothetical protein